MPKIPLYDQQQLASSAVGTPGVDTSGQQLGNAVASTADAANDDIYTARIWQARAMREAQEKQAEAAKQIDDHNRNVAVSQVLSGYDVASNGVLEKSKAANITTPANVASDVDEAFSAQQQAAQEAIKQARPGDSQAMDAVNEGVYKTHASRQMAAQTFQTTQAHDNTVAAAAAIQANAITQVGQIADGPPPLSPNGALDPLKAHARILAIQQTVKDQTARAMPNITTTMQEDAQQAYINELTDKSARAVLAADAGTGSVELLNYDIKALGNAVNPLDRAKYFESMHSLLAQQQAAQKEQQHIAQTKSTMQFDDEQYHLVVSGASPTAIYQHAQQGVQSGAISTGRYQASLDQAEAVQRHQQALAKAEGIEQAKAARLSANTQARNAIGGYITARSAADQLIQTADPAHGIIALDKLGTSYTEMMQANMALHKAGLPPNQTLVDKMSVIKAVLGPEIRSTTHLTDSVKNVDQFRKLMVSPLPTFHSDAGVNTQAQVKYIQYAMGSYNDDVNNNRNLDTSGNLNIQRAAAVRAWAIGKVRAEINAGAHR